MLRYVLRNREIHPFPRPEDMPEALHALLVGRGIASEAEARAFLNPGLDDLHDPMLLGGMDRAVARIRRAMAAGESICVYGDYDVDGVCASAILSGWLREQGANAWVYLPSRHSEGYGLNEEAVRKIAAEASLMVTVDCGVTSVELVALAKSLGLDVIVTDHHRPLEARDSDGFALPDCPVIDPLLDGYPFPGLCGAGVAWKLVWALAGDVEAAMERVDIAALATVADVVPLVEENRAIVRMGLERINRAPRPGIAALIEAAGLPGKPVTSTAIAFQLAPRLNAGGRLGSAKRSLELIDARDAGEARELAEELDAENDRRRSVEQQILQEAEAQLKDFDFAAHRALILAGKGWNPGVIGLAASRLVERWHYPVVLLSDQGDRLTGSCRSIEGVDIHAALCGCAETLQRFGGHRQAAGLTLLPENLEPFRRAMDAWMTANVDPNAYIPVREYDAELDFGEINPGFIAALEAVQPTGFGNPAPLFRVRAEVVEARAVGAEGAHLKLTLAQGGRRIGGIAFREGARADALSDAVDALVVPRLNTYLGRTEPQVEVRALADADVLRRLDTKLGEESRMQCDFLTEIFYNKKIVPFEEEARTVDGETLRRWLGERPQGTLVVAAGFGPARALLEDLEDRAPDLCLGALPEDPRAFNALCVCPVSRTPPEPREGRALPGYDRVVLAGAPEEWAEGLIGVEVYRLANTPPWPGPLPSLEDMRAAYRALMRVTRRPAWCRSLGQLARVTAEEAGLGEVPVAASLLAMTDMGLFSLALDEQPVAIRRSERAKASPEESAAWRAIQRWREEGKG